jgi:hypothetical protein
MHENVRKEKCTMPDLALGTVYATVTNNGNPATATKVVSHGQPFFIEVPVSVPQEAFDEGSAYGLSIVATDVNTGAIIAGTPVPIAGHIQDPNWPAANGLNNQFNVQVNAVTKGDTYRIDVTTTLGVGGPEFEATFAPSFNVFVN